MRTLKGTYIFITLILFGLLLSSFFIKTETLSGFNNWRTGHGENSVQLIPKFGHNPLTTKNGKTVAHARFLVKDYGEMSFPINPNTPEDEEAYAIDLSKSHYITLTYKANVKVILQLREYNIHGGMQNHVTLPASKDYITQKIALSDFKGGLSPLNLKNVAKFNFAVLDNNPKDGFAEIIITAFDIDNHKY